MSAAARTTHPGPRRQWGSEKPRPPLPAVETPASNVRTWMGGLAIAGTILAWLAYMMLTIVNGVADNDVHPMPPVWQTVFYVLLMSLLTFSALMYLMARQGAMYRSRVHQRAPRADLEKHFADIDPSITVLIPSYAEEPSVVRSTVISAALQEFPNIRIVLLIDDPPQPKDEHARVILEGCRALPEQINTWLAEPAAMFTGPTVRRRGNASADEVLMVADEYDLAAGWLRAQQDTYPADTSTDEFMVSEVFGGLAVDFEAIAAALRMAVTEAAAVKKNRLYQLQQRLQRTFSAEVTSFERKRYISLSHEANKAMNLNAYLGLMGRSFAVDDSPKGVILTEFSQDPDLVVPDSDYLLTLDADSVLLRDYCLRLVYCLEQPGNERIAVIQTPYSAFRGARTRLERMAGATTDIQHLVHQGLTYFGATFWVGANAVIRKSALDDIVEVDYENGRQVRRYIQDRTVIEDTESSIDLVANDWTLYNYDERLSYSATPADFGSLVIQRGRWANGGLLIIPKFWKYIRTRKKQGNRVSKGEITLRFNYMASIAWASVGLLALLVLPFDSRLLSPVIFLAALPYFLALASDFHRLGYKRTDVFRMYGFNLILLPVNLAGCFKSLQQAATKAKIPFARTPKVNDRTAAPATYVLAAVAIAAFSFYTFTRQWVLGNTTNAMFAAANGVLTTYAIVAYIGVRNSIVDIALGAWEWIHVPRRRPAQVVADAGGHVDDDWEAVLFFGPGDPRRSSSVPHWHGTKTHWMGQDRRGNGSGASDSGLTPAAAPVPATEAGSIAAKGERAGALAHGSMPRPRSNGERQHPAPKDASHQAQPAAPGGSK